MKSRWVVISGLALFALIRLASAADTEYPPAGDNSTSEGRLVWLGTCESCHAYGIAGAPRPTKADEWAERVIKPRSTLYEHAIAGFFGPDDTYMPPKGGNELLSEDEVKAAVDYMLEFALRTILSKEKK